MKGDGDVQMGSGQVAVGSYSSVINVSDTPAPSTPIPTPPRSSPMPPVASPFPSPMQQPTLVRAARRLPHRYHNTRTKQKNENRPTIQQPNPKRQTETGPAKSSTFFYQPSSSPTSGSIHRSKTYQYQVNSDYRLVLELSQFLLQSRHVTSSSTPTSKANGKQTTAT